MWLPESALIRIRELEAHLRDSVPRWLYDAALVRIATQERRIDWQCDMLLRRGQSYPLPPDPAIVKAETEKARTAILQQASESDKEKVRVVIEQGTAMGLPQQEIVEAVKQTVPYWTEADISKAINAPSNGQ